MTIDGSLRDTSNSPLDTPTPSGDGVPFGVAGVLVGVAGVMVTYGEFFPDAAGISAVLAGLAVWATRSRSSRLRAAIAVLLAVFVVINAVYALGDLSHPESPPAFLATALIVGCGLVTISLAALSARHRPARGRRVWMVAGSAFAVLAGASLVASAAVEDDKIQGGDVEVVARDGAFPSEVRLAADSTALFVRNQDRYRHTLVIQGETDAVELPANAEVRIPVDLKPGTYRFVCNVAGHESMRGTLVVE